MHKWHVKEHIETFKEYYEITKKGKGVSIKDLESSEERGVKQQHSSTHVTKEVEEERPQFPSIIPENMKFLYLKKSLVQKLLKTESSESKITGSFVRVPSTLTNDLQEKSYKLVQVTGVTNQNTDTMLQISDVPGEIPINLLSDANFTEEECEDLRKKMKVGLIRKPTMDEFQETAILLHDDLTNHKGEDTSINQTSRKQELAPVQETKVTFVPPGLEEVQSSKNVIASCFRSPMEEVLRLHLDELLEALKILLTASVASLNLNVARAIPDVIENLLDQASIFKREKVIMDETSSFDIEKQTLSKKYSFLVEDDSSSSTCEQNFVERKKMILDELRQLDDRKKLILEESRQIDDKIEGFTEELSQIDEKITDVKKYKEVEMKLKNIEREKLDVSKKLASASNYFHDHLKSHLLALLSIDGSSSGGPSILPN
ncbi:hypothetical protein M9H77_00367 [Catharanthus roseus]|nr:hypothetical protein M9H77_00367 [Catharanthus roseus]